MKHRRVNAVDSSPLDDPQQSHATQLQPRGNAAAASQIGGVESSGFEAQHATPDHVDMGGDMVLHIGPHTLTSGQLNGLSDYVRDPSELESMSVADLQRGLELMNSEPLSVADEAELMALFPAYAELSLDNSNHFGASDPDLCEPSGGSGSANYRAEITHWLGSAVEQARTAGEHGDAAGRERALVDAAFGSHFIADGFSAGHLFNKDDLVAAMGAGLDAARIETKGAMVASAAQRIHTEGADQLAHWRHIIDVPLRGPVRVPVTVAHIAAMVGHVVFNDRPLLGNGVVLAVHEVLSEAGVEVTDGTATWTMFGDHHLDDTTFERGAGLIDRSLHLVEEAFYSPDTTSGSAAVAEVLAALPVPTAEGAEGVGAAIERACDVHGGGMEDAVVLGSLTMLDTIMRMASPDLPVGRFERIDTGLAPPEAAPEAPRRGTVHVVQPGEWLSTIADAHYGDPARYDVLFEANHDRIEGFDDPDHIEPGWSLEVPEIDEAEAA